MYPATEEATARMYPAIAAATVELIVPPTTRKRKQRLEALKLCSVYRNILEQKKRARLAAVAAEQQEAAAVAE